MGLARLASGRPGQPVLAAWEQDIKRSGVVGGSVARTRELLAKALNVLAELPAPGDPLPVLADRVLKDAVTTARFTWNGHDLLRDDTALFRT